MLTPDYTYRYRLCLVLIAGLMLIGAGLAGAQIGRLSDAARDPFTCVEDEPCWDCSTMGNRICGPEAGR